MHSSDLRSDFFEIFLKFAPGSFTHAYYYNGGNKNELATLQLMTDTELLTTFVRFQDRDALAKLVARYERLVWSVCQRTLNNRTDIEDAFQTTFLILATKADRIRKPESLSNWLYGVARRTAFKIRNQRTVQTFDDGFEVNSRLIDRDRSVLEAITRQHEIDLVDQKLEAMHEKYRTPLVLRYFVGLTAKQIADQLNLSVAAVEGRLRRATARMESELRSNGISCSSLGLLTGVCLPRPELAAATVHACVTNSAGISVGVTTGTNLGTKLMICKTLCVAGISAIVAIAGYLHSGGPNTNELASNDLTVVVDGDQESASPPISVESLTDECCEDCEVCSSFHAHLEFVHLKIAEHCNDVCALFGCCEGDLGSD